MKADDNQRIQILTLNCWYAFTSSLHLIQGLEAHFKASKESYASISGQVVHYM